ncbi:MAG: pyruvate kinase, partial [Clostridium sp.]
MKRTKIICTMGPNTNDREVMKQLVLNGMDVARFNFSHGDYEEHMERMKILDSIRTELDIPIATLLDTKGPEIRTGLLKDGKKIVLQEGDTYILTTEKIVGDEKRGSINYVGLAEDVQAGNKILIDDGLLELDVTEVKGQEIICRVANGGELGEQKGV